MMETTIHIGGMRKADSSSNSYGSYNYNFMVLERAQGYSRHGGSSLWLCRTYRMNLVGRRYHYESSD